MFGSDWLDLGPSGPQGTQSTSFGTKCPLIAFLAGFGGLEQVLNGIRAVAEQFFGSNLDIEWRRLIVRDFFHSRLSTKDERIETNQIL